MEDLDAVARTSLLTTALRARETERPDRLYEDHYAAKLAGAIGPRLFDQVWSATVPNRGEREHKLPSTFDYNAIRTRFFDDYLLAEVARRGATQVVLVASGMDTRAYRLDWPAPVRIFELDRKAVLDAKAAALREDTVHPNVTLSATPVDLVADGWVESLTDAGYHSDQPAVWLLEGLLYYITEDQARTVLRQVGQIAAPGSAVAGDLVNAVALSAPVMRPLLEVFERWGCPWLFGSDEPEALFAEYGITAVARQPGEQGADYGRWPDPVRPREVPGVERVFYVRGVRV